VARPVRVEFRGDVYHVTARGNERKPIFRDERDRPAQVRKYLTDYLSANAQARSAWRSATAACASPTTAVRFTAQRPAFAGGRRLSTRSRHHDFRPLA
jgi:hypothetical protein